MNRSVLYILSFIFIFSVIIFAQNSKQQIAVLTLDPVGVNERESITLTNRLRSELVKTDAFTILERDKMDEILEEQGFQMTGCTSSECAVEAGQLLNVKQICSGSIGKIGSIYTVVVRLIDVETGEILKTVTEDCECPLERVLTNSMKNVAMKFAGKMANISGVRVLEKGTGDIFIKTDPPGAEVFFDDMKMDKVTPLTLRNVAAGEHKIEAVKGDFVGSKIIRIKDKELYREEIVLKKAKGSIKIFSDPPEAEITLDGNGYGKTPRLLQNVGSGTYTLKISKTGFMPFKETIRIFPGKVKTVDANLKKMVLLSLSSKPSGAYITINNKNRGRTPAMIYVSPEIQLNIRITKKGYEESLKKITLEQGQYKKINMTLNESRGIVRFDINPKDARVYINGADYKNGELINLTVGEYRAAISRVGYLDKKIYFNIQYNQGKKIRVLLTQKTLSGAFKRSFVPGWGQNYQEKTIRSSLYPLIFTGCATGSYLYYKKYNDDLDAYNLAIENYHNAFDEQEIIDYRKQMDEAHDKAVDTKNIRNAFYISTVVIYLWNITDVLLLPPSWGDKVSLSVEAGNKMYGARVSIKID